LLVIVAPVFSSRLVALLAGAWTAAAACASFGTISSSHAFDAGRIGVVPVDARHVAAVLIAAVAVVAAGWHPERAKPAAIAVSPLVFVLLPWLPFPVPAVFLAWSGALASLVWIAVALAIGAVALRNVTFYAPSRPKPLGAGLAALAIFAAAAWHASPSIPAGDEPHYLIITQSLLYDGDLQIENNHARGDYRAYFAGDLQPDSIRPGRNGHIYSIHAPGLPALVLPAFAVAGYHGVVIFLILLASVASALAWWLAWRTTGSVAAAWFGWATVTLSAPFLLETFTVYPDGPGAAAVLSGFWALLRAGWEREGVEEADPSIPSTASNPSTWFLHGLALATLPWMHTRFAVLAATLGGLVLVRLARAPRPLAKAIAFLAAPAVSALAWLFFFAVVYGTPDPSAPYGRHVDNSFLYLADGLGGVLFDQGFGLFAAAPVLAVAIAGFTRTRRLAIEWTVTAFPYLLAVTTFAMWWAGMSGPARFLVPLVLPLAIPAACAWASVSPDRRVPPDPRPRNGARVVMLAALIVSIWLSGVMAGGGGGHLGYHTRNEGGLTAAPWMEWANHAVDLPAAFPAFVPLPVGSPVGARTAAAHAGFAATLPWVFILGLAAWFVVWLIDRRSLTREKAIAAAALTFGCAVMLATSLAWSLHGGDPITPVPAQMDVLRRIASTRGRVAAFDLVRHRRLNRTDVQSLPIEAPIRRDATIGARALTRPLATFPVLPAGSYTLSVKRRASGDGWMMAGVGNDQFAIVTQPIAAFAEGIRVDLPVGVRMLTVRGDEAARAQLDAIVVRPIALAPPVSPALARRAVRYTDGVVFFLDERSFPEPSGFWVGGRRDASMVLAPDHPRQSEALLLRNAPVANVITLESGGWRQSLTLGADEQRRVDVPLDAGRALLRVACSSGFRPSQVNASSRDTRFLGVFVRTVAP
jgi:hypothetical protein